LNSIKRPAVNVIQTAAKTGAEDKNLTKPSDIEYLQILKKIYDVELIAKLFEIDR
jgi:hypothetical protein